jgi:hypothetical protein
MNRALKLLAVFVALALPALAHAQGSGTSAVPRPPDLSGAEAAQPFAVTRSVTGRIARIDAANHLLIIEDDKGKHYELKLAKGTHFKADKKTELAGRKKLTIDDFEIGWAVKVTYLASDSTITELRLRKVKS